MNENLELKVDELTDVIKNMSQRQFDDTGIEAVLNEFAQKINDSNVQGLDKLADSVSESMFDILDKKNFRISEQLEVIEGLITSFEQNGKTSKIQNDVERIINDIEALHSKISDQESRVEKLQRTVEDSSRNGGFKDVSRMVDEISSISDSYDNIKETLNNNFQEFLMRVEQSGSREDFQRIRYYLENIDTSQGSLSSMISELTKKQDELTEAIKQSSNSQTEERFEQIQGSIGQITKIISELTSKSDLDVIADKIGTLGALLDEFGRALDEDKNNDIKNVFQNQLNNILSALEGLKLGSNSEVGEDIIRLYTSIAEFKDGTYSAIDTKLNEVIASVEAKLEKVTSSINGFSIDSSESIETISSEVQKLNDIAIEGLNSKSSELKNDIIGAINDRFDNAISRLNPEEVTKILSRLDNSETMHNLKLLLDSINDRIDFSPIEERIQNLREVINSVEFEEKFELLEEKLQSINNLQQELSSVKSLDQALFEIKERLEESFKLNSERINSDDELKASVKEALNTIYQTVCENNITDALVEKLEVLDTKINSISNEISKPLDNSELSNLIENFKNNVSNEFDSVQNSIKSSISELREEVPKVEEIKYALDDFCESFLQGTKELSEKISALKDTSSNTDLLKNGLELLETTLKEKLENLNSGLLDVENKIDEKIQEHLLFNLDNLKADVQNFIQNLIEQNNNEAIQNLQDSLISNIKNTSEEIIKSFKEEKNAFFEAFGNRIYDSKEETIQKVITAIEALENSSSRLELVRTLTSSIEETLNNTVSLKAYFESNKEFENELKETVNNLGAVITKDFETTKDMFSSSLEELLEASDKNKDGVEKIMLSFEQNIYEKFISEKEAVSSLINTLENALLSEITKVKSETTETVNENIKLQLENAIEKLSSVIANDVVNNEKLDESKENIIQTLTALYDEKITNLEEKLGQAINFHSEQNKTFFETNLADKSNEIINNIVQDVKDKTEILSEKIEKTIENTSSIDSSLAELMTIKNDIEEKFKQASEISLNILKSFSKVDEAKNEINLRINRNVEISNAVMDTLQKLDTMKVDIEDKIDKTIENEINIENRLQELDLFKEEFTDKLDRTLENGISISDELVKLDSIRSELSEKLDRTLENDISIAEALSKLDFIKDNVETGFNKTSEVSNLINNKLSRIDLLKDEINQRIEKINQDLKNDFELIKAQFAEKVDQSEDEASALMSLTNMIEQKIQNKIASMELLINDSVNRIDLKTNETFAKVTEDYKNNLEAKTDFIVDELKTELGVKIVDVQKIIDEKVYEIISRNNDVLKDEMKLRIDTTLRDVSREINDKISKVEEIVSKNENEEQEGETYTLKDLETDVAKIRLGIEKSNKLSNFKEFASRLVELKNINLENAKISRVIGADIMRFDSWLKSASAKIDVLAAKIDKSEKIKMEDLKTRLMQSEKNQAMPQKFEEAIMTIYKKYRTQENKIEELISKIDLLPEKTGGEFDVKEFIDIFYDNNSKTQNLISRMDSLEDKMDLIQAKIDHIISSCIPE